MEQTLEQKTEIDNELVGWLYAEAMNLCAVANRVENTWFKESPQMRNDVDSLRNILNQFNMILYGKKYNA